MLLNLGSPRLVESKPPGYTLPPEMINEHIKISGNPILVTPSELRERSANASNGGNNNSLDNKG